MQEGNIYMKLWLNRQLDRILALGIEMFLMFLFIWESVLENHHDPHACHHDHCHTCAQISAVKSIIHYISLYQISIVASEVILPVNSLCISSEHQEGKTISLVSLKIRMNN